MGLYPLLALAVLLANASGAQAQAGEQGVGLTTANQLVFFNTSSPGTQTPGRPPITISGIQPGEVILAIDVRPSTNQLYGVGSTSRIYIIEPFTGVATAVNATPFAPQIDGNATGFDFNPVPDLIRLVTDADQNLRINPNTGQVAGALQISVPYKVV